MLWEGRRILECRSRGDLARSGSGSSGVRPDLEVIG